MLFRDAVCTWQVGTQLTMNLAGSGKAWISSRYAVSKRGCAGQVHLEVQRLELAARMKGRSMEKTKDAYQKKVEAQLREIEARIAVLKARAEKSTAEAQIKYNRKIDEMQYEYGRLKARFKEFIESSQDAWKELQTGLDEAIGDLKETVESAANQITK